MWMVKCVAGLECGWMGELGENNLEHVCKHRQFLQSHTEVSHHRSPQKLYIMMRENFVLIRIFVSGKTYLSKAGMTINPRTVMCGSSAVLCLCYRHAANSLTPVYGEQFNRVAARVSL